MPVHPECIRWFKEAVGSPTEVQTQAWQAISEGRHTLVAAPTGAGKTLAAFLAVISDLIPEAQAEPPLQGIEVVYISPLKALSYDIQRNLQLPLDAIAASLNSTGVLEQPLKLACAVRTGDTPAQERRRMLLKPPNILATTPESLYLLLTSKLGRTALKTVKRVIVDEVHAVAANKRGAHLALSLERLDWLRSMEGLEPVQRIGLSATQEPLNRAAAFLCGVKPSASGLQNPARLREAAVIAGDRVRGTELALLLPQAPLGAIMSAEIWHEIYQRIVDLAAQHRTMLVFTPTRRMAERVARKLETLLHQEQGSSESADHRPCERSVDASVRVAAHHGSLSSVVRRDVEKRLQSGQLKIVVATAALELGIDIGQVDLVCQLGSPHSINVLLQRAGRSGRSPGAQAQCLLVPLSRDDLRECCALLSLVEERILDQLEIPAGALDVLCQQVIAEVSAHPEGVDIGTLYERFVRAYPYRNMSRADFDRVVEMVANNFSEHRTRGAKLLHLDAINAKIRPARAARLTALLNAGVIPDQFDYDVILEPKGDRIGAVGEDFATESLAGDIFQLGNQSYRILRIEDGRVRVSDAQGEPPTFPFWFGEAPGRSKELSTAVARLNTEFQRRYQHHRRKLSASDAAQECAVWLQRTYLRSQDQCVASSAAAQLALYLAAGCEILGSLPNEQQVIFERFHDAAGDAHLVIHSAFGSRINKAWGLALRKKFCRKFNFELQASALEDCIIISLSAVHSFPLAEPASYLRSQELKNVFEQAVVDIQLFVNRWRWCASNALALSKRMAGRRTPAPIQRARSEDLLAQIFPDQLACQENLAGERTIPAHPIVQQALADCAGEAMDLPGLQQVIQGIEQKRIKILTAELPAPSPLTEEVLLAKPYAFIDDGEAEDRRTRAVQTGVSPTDIQEASDHTLTQAAFDQVQAEITPVIRNAEELHAALLLAGSVCWDQAVSWVGQSEALSQWLQQLSRAGRIRVLVQEQTSWLFAAETWPAVVRCLNEPDDCEQQLAHLMRGCLSVRLLSSLEDCIQAFAFLKAERSVSPNQIESAVLTLQAEGFAMQFNWRGQAYWCERALFARVGRYSLRKRREQIRPVSTSAYMRFLLHWQGLLDEDRSGPAALSATLASLGGVLCPAALWEREILPMRMQRYKTEWLDQLCLTGALCWRSLSVAKSGGSYFFNAQTSLTMMPREQSRLWIKAAALGQCAVPDSAEAGRYLSSAARAVLDLLEKKGALFYDELRQGVGLLPAQADQVLRELVASGLVAADTFAAVRMLMLPDKARLKKRNRRLGWHAMPGRWHKLDLSAQTDFWEAEDEEALVLVLLQRYGLLFQPLAYRERASLPPWRVLLAACRRLESKGRIRGGRFIEGVFGEQFALPQVLPLLKRAEGMELGCGSVVVSACDPVNLTGVMRAGEGANRIPAISGYRVLYRAGEAVGARIKGDVQALSQEPISHAERTMLVQAERSRLRVRL
ncbi:MAG: DEAD/DEAH box helicase [Gammaproteobacteria bacterium]